MGTRSFPPNSGDPWLLSLPHDASQGMSRTVPPGSFCWYLSTPPHNCFSKCLEGLANTHTWRVLLSMGVFRNVEFSLEQEHAVYFQIIFGRCLTSSVISYFLNTSCAKALIHYCTAKHVRAPAAVHDAWLDQLACTEKLIEQNNHIWGGLRMLLNLTAVILRA